MSWEDDYAEELRSTTQELTSLTYDSYGQTPTVEFELVPVMELRVKVTTPGSGRVADYNLTLRVDEEDMRRGKKRARNVAKRLGRQINWTYQSYGGNHAPLWAKERYLMAKLEGTTYSYHNYTAEQLEEPPTPLDRKLHPAISRRINSLRNRTEDMAIPRRYEWIRPRARPVHIPGASIPLPADVRQPHFDSSVEDLA